MSEMTGAERQRVDETTYEKRKARWTVKDAIKSGKLRRGPCEQRGRDCSGPIEGHHDDYSKPLGVRWLCLRHHRSLRT